MGFADFILLSVGFGPPGDGISMRIRWSVLSFPLDPWVMIFTPASRSCYMVVKIAISSLNVLASGDTGV